jgi:serine/threonine-protein kinase
VTELERLCSVRDLLITRPIASGGMGAVYEAQLRGVAGFSKTVAVKTIRERFARDSEFVRLFIGEAKLVADLVHENIVQVYDLGADGDRYFIVMEFVEGINLEQFMSHHREREEQVPVELGAFIASRVCRGLEYAHTRRDREGRELGIVHRDISSKNVLLNFEGVVKITDFGIAKAREVMEQNERLLMGRIEYMSPEQARREPSDARSDLYALGVLMYELLTGALPDRGRGSLLQLHREGVAFARPARAARPDLPDDLAAIIDRVLQPDAADRFQSAGEMGYALEYHLYREGYGPTNLTLGEYLRDRFPHSAGATSRQSLDRTFGSAHLVTQRAETLFGELLEIPDPPADDR